MVKFISCESGAADSDRALAEILEQIGDFEPDVAFVFATSLHTPHMQQLGEHLEQAHPGCTVFGCSGAGVVGGGQEREAGTWLSATFACLPEVRRTAFHVTADELPLSSDEWRRRAGSDPSGILVLSDPFSLDLTEALAGLQQAFPGVLIAGGQASGGRGAGSLAMLSAGGAHNAGLVGLSLAGPLRLDALVAQGCRPVGPPMFVTSCEGNCILGLDGKDPIEALRQIHTDLSPSDREIFRRALFLGVQMRDQHEYQPGDFLIRNILGVPRGEPGLAVAYEPQRFSVVQAHVRDAEAAREDLRGVLEGHRQHAAELGSPAGALLFTCVGRGEGLFGEVGHDSRMFQELVGATPLGGFFCNGEIGPVQGEVFLHGYTSVFVTFRPDWVESS